MAFKKKEVTHAERIEKAKGKFAEAQEMFVQAKDQLEASDAELNSVISEASTRIKELEQVILSADEHKEKNAKFKTKLAEFIEI